MISIAAAATCAAVEISPRGVKVDLDTNVGKVSVAEDRGNAKALTRLQPAWWKIARWLDGIGGMSGPQPYPANC